MSRPQLPATLKAFATEVLLLASTMEAAESIMYKRSHHAKPADDTTERSKGGHSDPTFDTTSDTRRLKVRAAYEAGSLTLAEAVRLVQQRRALLEKAAAAWQDDTPQADDFH